MNAPTVVDSSNKGARMHLRKNFSNSDRELVYSDGRNLSSHLLVQGVPNQKCLYPLGCDISFLGAREAGP